MKFDYSGQDYQRVDSFKGGEGYLDAKMYNDSENRIVYGRLDPGCTIGKHKHEGTSEIVFVTAGALRVMCDDKEEIVSAGGCHYCPNGHSHEVFNASDSVTAEMFCVVPVHPA